MDNWPYKVGSHAQTYAQTCLLAPPCFRLWKRLADSCPCLLVPCSALIALFTDFAHLANMISIGTFLVFYVVAIALLWLRS